MQKNLTLIYKTWKMKVNKKKLNIIDKLIYNTRINKKRSQFINLDFCKDMIYSIENLFYTLRFVPINKKEFVDRVIQHFNVNANANINKINFIFSKE